MNFTKTLLLTLCFAASTSNVIAEDNTTATAKKYPRTNIDVLKDPACWFMTASAAALVLASTKNELKFGLHSAALFIAALSAALSREQAIPHLSQASLGFWMYAITLAPLMVFGRAFGQIK